MGHAHDGATAHVTIVTSGEITVIQPGQDEEILKPGQSIYFAPGEYHRIVASADDTRIYNILTGG